MFYFYKTKCLFIGPSSYEWSDIFSDIKFECYLTLLDSPLFSDPNYIHITFVPRIMNPYYGLKYQNMSFQ